MFQHILNVLKIKADKKLNEKFSICYENMGAKKVEMFFKNYLLPLPFDARLRQGV